jgi:hypothetical protein
VPTLIKNNPKTTVAEFSGVNVNAISCRSSTTHKTERTPMCIWTQPLAPAYADLNTHTADVNGHMTQEKAVYFFSGFF